MASPSKPDPCDEHSLAERLLAALEKGDVDEARLIQGEILGLHLAKLRLFAASLLKGRPEVHLEEVFGNAAERMFVELDRPPKVAWARDVGSFWPLMSRIVKDAAIDYWRGRGPYKDDRRTTSGVQPGLIEAAELEDPVADLLDADAFAADAARVLEAVGGAKTLDGLLLILIDLRGIPLKKVERLLVLAEQTDRGAALRKAAALLAAREDEASQYLDLIRECPSARPMTYNALRVAIHRARRRGRGEHKPTDLDGLS